jgi:hypothetical protein
MGTPAIKSNGISRDEFLAWVKRTRGSAVQAQCAKMVAAGTLVTDPVGVTFKAEAVVYRSQLHEAGKTAANGFDDSV